PAPFGPSKPTTSPARTETLTPARMSRPPSRLVIASARSCGAGARWPSAPMIALRAAAAGGLLRGRIEHRADPVLSALDHAALLIEIDHHAVTLDLVGSLLQARLLRERDRPRSVVEHSAPTGGTAVPLVDAHLALGDDLARPLRLVGVEGDAQRIAVQRHVGLGDDDLAAVGQHA